MSSQTEHIRALNDAMRKEIRTGGAFITPGIAALGKSAVDRIIETISIFDDFCNANDPWEEHDFGSFEAAGKTIVFKIDYYDLGLSQHSENPANPAVTRRILTVMLAEEY